MKLPPTAYNGFLRVYRPWSAYDNDAAPCRVLLPTQHRETKTMKPALVVPSKFHFLKWLHNARKGDVCVYHVGTLTADRLRSRATNEMGSAAWKAAEDGRVYLTQSRKDVTGSFYYMATKAK